MDFTRFYYETKGSLKGVGLLGFMLGLSKGYSSLKPIEAGSITIFLHKAMSKEELANVKDIEQFAHYALCCGTKPLDLIAFLACMRATDAPRFDLFEFKQGKYDAGRQSVAIALLAATVVIFVSRGSFPAQDEARGKTNLPAFVKHMLNGVDTEKKLSDLLGSFDFKHVDTVGFFEEPNLTGWDEVMSNRLNLGVAGHKPLKVAAELAVKYQEKSSTPAEKYVGMLLKAFIDAKGGFYPALHPANQTFSSQYKGFYSQSLAALYDALPGTKDEKLQTLRSSSALKNEKLLIADASGEARIVTIPRVYQSWSLDAMLSSMGKPVRYTAEKSKPGQALVPEEGVIPKSGSSGLTLPKGK